MSVQFVPLSTFVDTSFWSEVNRRKLNEWKLDESPIPVVATYTSAAGELTTPLLSLSYDAFVDDPHEKLPRGVMRVSGSLIVFNTLEGYERVNREALIREYASKIVDVIKTKRWLTSPSLLNNFILTVFADLKKYRYFYWNCMPALIYPRRMEMLKPPEVLPQEKASMIFRHVPKYNGEPFLLTPYGDAPLSDLVLDNSLVPAAVDVVFMDPSTEKLVPGWPLRNLVAAVADARKDWNTVQVVCFRCGRSLSAFRIFISWDFQQDALSNDAVGWERDIAGRPARSSVDLRNCFDPKRLMEQSVELNLRLIRWRLVPSLELERYSNLKCLILGSGTLGCNIARGLLGWGIRHFTFIDNATVSFSNPVRQSLFEYTDALEGGKSKAVAAADSLRRIFPSVHADAYNIKIPVPGHTVSASEKNEVKKVVDLLEELVTTHDVIFLVMDSREARWLPSLLSTVHNKLALSVALGFDSFVVVRHGFGRPDNLSENISLDALVIPGTHLGCYFCCDVTAPGNTTTDRTLDQQCTVSRSGVSMQAAGAAVELLAAILQHPKTGESPARVDENDESSTILGATPHQIRYFVSKFQQITPTVIRFSHCVACGKAVCNAYEAERFDFLLKVFNEPKYLETVSGLEQMEQSFNEMSVWAFNDDDSVASSNSI